MLFLLVLPFLFICSARAQCYNPNGTSMPSDFTPCSSDGVSMCCALGRPANDLTQNFCRADGLCEEPGMNEIWREGCTDETWEDPRCVKLCVDGDYALGTALITVCSDGLFCCGKGNTTCCAAGDGVTLNSDGTTSPARSTLVPTIPSSSNGTSFNGTILDLPASPSNSNLKTTILAVGLVLGFIILILLAIILTCVMRKRKQNPAVATTSNSAAPQVSQTPRNYISPDPVNDTNGGWGPLGNNVRSSNDPLHDDGATHPAQPGQSSRV